MLLLSADGLSRFNYKWAVDIYIVIYYCCIYLYIYTSSSTQQQLLKMCWVLLSLVSRTAAYIILSRPLGNRRNFVSKKTFCKDETIYYIPSVRGESYRENIFLYTDISQVCGTRQKSEISLALSITLCTFSTDCIRHSPRREGGRSTSTWPLRVWLLGEIYTLDHIVSYLDHPQVSLLYTAAHTQSLNT